MPGDDIIEGEAVEVEPIRTMVVQQPGQALVSDPTEGGPAAMLERATSIATVLSRMVEAQKLYTVISGKKYPQVEAWMTIGRMDNVVAREAATPTVDDEGAWTAEVELVRLSDGMVIGRASAMCGAKGDRPWDTRPTHQRRSMSVTRATSRAFRQQYSWIMALAGYEPTPADEMPQPEGRRDSFADSPYGHDSPAENRTTHRDGLVGKAITQGNQDGQLRQGPDGPSLPFRIKEGRLSQIVVAHGDIAAALDLIRADWLDKRVTIWGHYTDESYDKKNKDTGDSETIRYKVLHLERIQTPNGTLPAPSPEPTEASSVPLFDDDEQARLDAAMDAA